MAVTTAGQRVVAVGLRGHVVYSDDLGKSWVQARVPVSSDLVAVTFVGAREGWAVGHGGVVIHSSDGGANWEKQVDGDRLSRIAVAHYESLAGTRPDAKVSAALKRAKAVATDGSTKALLDVIFINEREASSSARSTASSAPRTAARAGCLGWSRPTTTNELHFYSVRASGGRLLLTGEQGMVWELDPGNRRRRGEADALQGHPVRFAGVTVPTSWCSACAAACSAAPTRGAAGPRSPIPEQAGITGGTVIDGKRMVLATQAGKLLVSDDAGTSFQPVKPARPMSYFGISAAPGGRVALVGSEGVQVEALP